MYDVSHPLDEIVHLMKSYPVHEMETVFFSLSEINANFMNKEIVVEIDSAEDIICGLCKKGEQIKKERQESHEGLKKAVIKMLQNSKAEIPEHKINDCVIIPVPKVNNRPSDPVNIFGTIVDQRNNMNRIGTQHELLKGRFGSGNLQLAISNFINVKNNKEITLCETVAALLRRLKWEKLPEETILTENREAFPRTIQTSPVLPTGLS
ncbi:Hypothetical protein CINCED_3A009304 [Cinara cedri]|uniref:Uncharacterized protein n=1 Tax=Cinara cedri TaxID=506608 RepID=A0A5E4NRT2_9HEMI|nr:Hypothetical protein CINCED_3A009304 [Cinara cedri]